MTNVETEEIVRQIKRILEIIKNEITFETFEKYFNYVANLLEKDDSYQFINTAKSLLRANVVTINDSEKQKYQEYKEYLQKYTEEENQTKIK